MMEFNVETYKWKQLPSMAEGKDLRNKIIVFNGEVYAIGGNNFTAEKFSINKNTWEVASSYQDLVDDNLDSWTCALYYDTKKAEDVKMTSTYNMPFKFNNPYTNNDLLYGYNEFEGNQDGLEQSSSSEGENFL